MKTLVPFLVLTLLLAACATPLPATSSDAQQIDQTQGKRPTPVHTESQPEADSATAAPVDSAPTPESAIPTDEAAHTSDVDHTHIPLGDGKLSSAPQSGYVWSCMSHTNVSSLGTFPWLNGDGTWDMTKKLTVDGSVTWTSLFTIAVQGDQRVFSTNDLPNHPTGSFPINPADDVYAYDRNPNSIREQSIVLQLPANPQIAAQPSCVGGEVGVMLSGVILFNSIDAEGHDAPANEVQDECGGHPQVSGLYHYHNLSKCLTDTSMGHSALMGYAFDGFGIFGPYGEDGKELTNADLDECHGHTHVIEWDGQQVVMYHYHLTNQFPYSVGCYRGTPTVQGPIGGGQGGSQGGQPPAGGPPQGAPPPKP